MSEATPTQPKPLVQKKAAAEKAYKESIIEAEMMQTNHSNQISNGKNVHDYLATLQMLEMDPWMFLVAPLLLKLQKRGLIKKMDLEDFKHIAKTNIRIRADYLKLKAKEKLEGKAVNTPEELQRLKAAAIKNVTGGEVKPTGVETEESEPVTT